MAGLLTASEIASMTATVQASLDVTVDVQRKSTSIDGYGHTSETWNTVIAALPCNIIIPSATQLQSYAGVIGSQWANLIRVMQSVDLREGDRVVHGGRTWTVQHILNAESYTFTQEALITVVV